MTRRRHWKVPDATWCHRTDWTPPHIGRARNGGGRKPDVDDEQVEAMLATRGDYPPADDMVVDKRFIPLVLAADCLTAASSSPRSLIRVHSGGRIVAAFMPLDDRRPCADSIRLQAVVQMRRWL